MSKPKTLKLLAVILCLTICLSTEIWPSEAQASPQIVEYVFQRSWGGEGDQLNSPMNIAIGQDSTIYVTNCDIDHITVINPGERSFTAWGSTGSSEGQLDCPMGIAINDEGSVYIADTLNNRIQKFNSEGVFLASFGDYGDGAGHFIYPIGIAFNEVGQIFILDRSRVQIFAADHTFLAEWVPQEPFMFPRDIAVDKNGYVYITDTYNHRIQVYTSEGELIDIWGENGVEPGQFQYPEGIAIDENGLVYIADFSNGRIQVFTPTGLLVNAWVWGGIQGASDVTFDRNGRIYVADYGNDRIQRFTSDGQPDFFWSSNRSAAIRFFYPEGITMGQNEQIYISNNEEVAKFNIDGSLVNSWDLLGRNEGSVHYVPQAWGIGIGQNDLVYVVDSPNHQIEKFTADGDFLMAWGEEGNENGHFSSPAGLAFDADGNVYVADSNNDRIQKFTSDGIFLDTWGSEGSGLGQFNLPTGIAIDTRGFVFVVDFGNDRIQKFTLDGNFVDSWGSTGQEIGEFQMPIGITVATEGNVYIADTNNHRVQVFDPNGGFITAFGEYGSEEGMLNAPRAIAVSASGDIHVVDTDNHRIQVFSPAYPSSDSTSGRVQNGSFEQDPALTKWTYGGSLPVQQDRTAIHGSYSMMLGNVVPAVEQGRGDAWAYQTMYIDPTWARPVLSFRYNLTVNDIMDYSDFFVEIQDGIGLNHLATVLRDGFEPCIPNVAPPAGTDLGWRSVSYDLSAYKGQNIRLVFINRNLWPASWGIWTRVDDVRVVDAGPLPVHENHQKVFLPLLNNGSCDSLPGSYKLQPLIRPELLP